MRSHAVRAFHRRAYFHHLPFRSLLTRDGPPARSIVARPVLEPLCRRPALNGRPTKAAGKRPTECPGESRRFHRRHDENRREVILNGEEEEGCQEGHEEEGREEEEVIEDNLDLARPWGLVG